MGYSVGVIESIPGETPDQLASALRDLDSVVRIFSMDDLQTMAENPRVDVFVASAEVPPSELNNLMLRFADADPAPVVLVFTETRFDSLAPHIARGRDYLVPPFRPELLRARMRTCREREQFSASIAAADAAARLASDDRDIEIAREIQVGFLPETLPQPTGWELGVRFQPARKVAGDFYDAYWVANGRRVAFLVADVCDKGVGAALFMALIRSLLRHTAEYSGLQGLAAEEFMLNAAGMQDIERLPIAGAMPMMNAIRSTNGYLTRNHADQGYFATMFFGVLDPVTGKIAYVNCGHNPPLLVRSRGTDSVSLELTGPAVGIIPDCLYTLGRATVGPGDTLFIYTDGVTEAKTPTGEFFGDDRLAQVVCAANVAGHTILDSVEHALDDHISTADQFDDITMMSIHRLPATAQQTIWE
ncbi:MAG TPA: PP2C family protein-serine/threonine phosphatase [Streptosporangiaceae bacterium]|nr:PP2C family protein-serine/threonine phosphatase [Streptosporangiaceae bacterium]